MQRTEWAAGTPASFPLTSCLISLPEVEPACDLDNLEAGSCDPLSRHHGFCSLQDVLEDRDERYGDNYTAMIP